MAALDTAAQGRGNRYLYGHPSRCDRRAVLLRAIGLAVAGVVSAAVGGVAMYAFQDEAAVQTVPTATPVEVTRAALARELATATAVGFGPAEDVSASARAATPGGPLQLSVTLGARECVAVIAGLSGYQHLSALSLAAPAASGTVAEAAVDRPDGAAAQVQYCATRPMTVVASVATVRRSHERPPRYTDSATTVLLARAPWSATRGFAGLRRGRYDASAVTFAGRDAVWDDLASQRPAGAVAAWPAASLDRAHAAVAPPTRGLVTWFATLSARETGAPMGHPRVAWDTTWAGAAALESLLPAAVAAHDPVVDVGFNAYRRVLLATEPGPPGSGCVTLIFGRARYRTRPQVWRWTGEGAPDLLAEAGNFARDAVCEGGPRRLYLTADDNADVYRVEAWR